MQYTDVRHTGRDSLRTLWHLAVPEWRPLTLLACIQVVAGALPLAIAPVSRDAIDGFVRRHEASQASIAWGLLVITACLLMGASLWLIGTALTRITTRMSITVFDRFIRQPYESHAGRDSIAAGRETLTRSMREVEALVPFAFGIIWPVSALGSLVALVRDDGRWLIVAIAPVAVVLFTTFAVARRMMPLARTRAEQDTARTRIVEPISDDPGLRFVKRNALEKRFTGEYSAAATDLGRTRGTYMTLLAWQIAMLVVVPSLAGPFSWLTVDPARSVGETTTGAILLTQLVFSVGRCGDIVPYVVAAWPDLQRVLRAISEPVPTTAPIEAPVSASDLVGQPLVLRELSCTRGGRPVLRNVSLGLRPGDWVALIGANAAGKSTLVQAISGDLSEARDGSIRIGQIPVARIPASVRANHIRALDPVPTTFNGTVERNIRMLRPDATAMEVARACSIAQITFSLDRPASELSQGQRARMLVAQVVLARPAVLLLDEILKPIDRGTRRRIRRAIADELPDAIVIEVIHDYDDLVNAEMVFTDIVLLVDGTIAAQGALGELRRNPRFAELFDDDQARDDLRDTCRCPTRHRCEPASRGHARGRSAAA